MDFNLTEQQRQYLETVKRFVKAEITPQVMALEKGHVFPWDIIRKAWEMGIMNLTIPESVKGYEVDLISSALIIEELSYGDTGISTSAMCNDLANVVIAQQGSEEQKHLFLGPFVERPLLASFCLTEPGAGSDNTSMSAFIGCVIVPTQAVSHSGDEQIAEPPRERVPLEGGRILLGKPEDKLGQRLSNTASVIFEDVVIKPHQIIGDRRLGFKYLLNVLDYARPMVAAIGVGHARRALDLTLAYTRERKQFGKRICDLPVARETLVAMWRKVELAELALMKASFMVQQQAPECGIYASLAKNVAAEAALFCAHEGLHLHGGYGFMSEYEISKLARDAHIIDIYEGVREIQNMIIGREIV